MNCVDNAWDLDNVVTMWSSRDRLNSGVSIMWQTDHWSCVCCHVAHWWQMTSVTYLNILWQSHDSCKNLCRWFTLSCQWCPVSEVGREWLLWDASVVCVINGLLSAHLYCGGCVCTPPVVISRSDRCLSSHLDLCHRFACDNGCVQPWWGPLSHSVWLTFHTPSGYTRTLTHSRTHAVVRRWPSRLPELFL